MVVRQNVSVNVSGFDCQCLLTESKISVVSVLIYTKHHNLKEILD